MSLIHCSCDCRYQRDGYCQLEEAAEITNYTNSEGCLHFVPAKEPQTEDKTRKDWYNNFE